MEAETLGPWLGNLFYFIGGIYVLVKLVDNFRRKPTVDVDLKDITGRLSSVESAVIAKQDTKVCDQAHAQWDRDIQGIRDRHTAHENKLSRQIASVHTRINEVFGELREITGIMKAKGGNA